MRRTLTLLVVLAAAPLLGGCHSSVFKSDRGPRTYVVSQTCQPIPCCPRNYGPPEGPIR